MRCFAFAIFCSFYSFLGFATTWYSKTGEADLTVLSSWTEFPNGTGAHPSNFTDSSDVFIIQSHHSFDLAQEWLFSSKLEVNGALTLNFKNLILNGDLLIKRGIFRLNNTSATNDTLTLKIEGNLIIDGGELDLGSSFSKVSQIALKGNLKVLSGRILNSSQNTSNALLFAGNLAQIFSQSNYVYDDQLIKYVLKKGAFVKLESSIYVRNLLLIEEGGTLDIPHPFHVKGIGTTQLSAGGTIATGHEEGITSVPNKGCIQTDLQDLSVKGIYSFNGSTPQVSGNINFASTVGKLIFNNSKGVQLSSNVTVRDTLFIQKGYHDLNGFTLRLGQSESSVLDWLSGGLYCRKNTGTFLRYIPTSANVSDQGSRYGLFPFAKSESQMSYLRLNSSNPLSNGGEIEIQPIFNSDSCKTWNVADGSKSIRLIQAGQTLKILKSTCTGGGNFRMSFESGTFARTSGADSSDICLATWKESGAIIVGSHSMNLGTLVQPKAIREGITDLTALNGINLCVGSYLTRTPLTYKCNLGGVRTIGPTGNYTSITSALNAISNGGMTSDLTLELQSNYTSVSESFPITIDPVSCSLDQFKLIIRPEKNASSLIISGSNSNGIFSFNKGDKVTVDGRPGGIGNVSQLSIINSNSNAPIVVFKNDASYNCLKYLSFSGGNTSVLDGLVVFSGTTGIGTTGNIGDSILNCTFNKFGGSTYKNAIFSNGQSSVKQNKSIVLKGNKFINFQTSAVYLYNNSRNWNLTNNHLFQTAAYTPTATHYGFLIKTGTAYTINENYIGGQGEFCSGNPYKLNASSNYYFPIYMTVDDSLTNSLQGNHIKNIDFSTTSNTGAYVTNPGVFSGMYVTGNTGAAGNIEIGNISGNVFGDTTLNPTNAIKITTNKDSCMIQAISVNAKGNVTIAQNSIGNIYTSNTVGKGYFFRGVYTTNTSNVSINSNKIGSTLTPNSIVLGGNLTGVGKCKFYGIVNESSGEIAVSDNLISNINVYGTSASILKGIVNSNGSIKASINGNNILNFSTSIGSNSSALTIGIENYAACETSIQKNTLSGINCRNGSFCGVKDDVVTTKLHSITLNKIGTELSPIQISSNVSSNHSGISLLKSGEYDVSENTIQNVEISSNTTSQLTGVKLNVNASSILLSKNTIKNLKHTFNGNSPVVIIGIGTENTLDGVQLTLSKNSILDITTHSNNTDNTKLISGVRCFISENVNKYTPFLKASNNVVNLIGIPLGGNVFGFDFYSVGLVNAQSTIYNNTFQIQTGNSSEISSVVQLGNSGSFTLKNNILLNKSASNNAYCVYKYPGSSIVEEANLYFTSNPLGSVGYFASPKDFTTWNTLTGAKNNQNSEIQISSDGRIITGKELVASKGENLFSDAILPVVSDRVDAVRPNGKMYIGAFEGDPKVFYYLGTGSLDDRMSWSTDRKGVSGVAPVSLEYEGCLFYIVDQGNISPTETTSNWKLGKNSKIIIGDGIDSVNFIIKHLIDCSNEGAELACDSNGRITLQTISLPKLGRLDGGSTIVFNGSQTQDVPTLIFSNLIVDNPKGIEAIGEIKINNDLRLENGNLLLGQHNLIIGELGAISSYGHQSYVISNDAGVLIQEGIDEHSLNGKKVFPMGAFSNSFTPCWIENSGVKDNFSVRVLDNHYRNGNSGDTSVTHKVDRIWLVDEAIKGGSNVTLTMQWNSKEELPSFNRSLCAIGHYETGTWDIDGVNGAIGQNPWSITRQGITSFSPFDISSPQELPIKLLYFNALLKNHKVQLDWATASEKNADYFVVERSSDGSVFSEVARNSAVGNSISKQSYRLFDEQPLNGISYYRLKEVDLNKVANYSDIKSVNYLFSKEDMFKIYPNPTENEQISIEFESSENSEFKVVVRNTLGQIIQNHRFNSNSGQNLIELNIAHLSSGTYFIELLKKDYLWKRDKFQVVHPYNEFSK
jgi:hypothetical protein